MIFTSSLEPQHFEHNLMHRLKKSANKRMNPLQAAIPMMLSSLTRGSPSLVVIFVGGVVSSGFSLFMVTSTTG